MWERYHRSGEPRPPSDVICDELEARLRPFVFERPETVDEAIDLLARHGSDARILAGGQSLLILMRRRLVQPGVVVSLSRVRELRSVDRGADGIRRGAMAPYGDVSRHETVIARAPLLARAAGA